MLLSGSVNDEIGMHWFLGWTSTLNGSSIEYGRSAGTALPAGHSGTLTFDSTTTPAEFMAQTGQAGKSTAYGVNAANGQLSFTLSPPDTEVFALRVSGACYRDAG
jgi:hypothetical protein